MNAAVGAVVLTPGAAGGAVFVDPEEMWSESTNNAAATTGDVPALATAAFDLAKNYCA